MFKGVLLNWLTGIAVVSLLAALAVYVFARTSPPGLLTSWHSFDADLAAYTGVFGSAPSLFYTLALGLLIAACGSSRSSAMVHCLVWIVLAMLLEISQARIIAEPVMAWLSGLLPRGIWAIAEPYWANGVFDPLDLFATVTGGALALALLIWLPSEKRNEARR